MKETMKTACRGFTAGDPPTGGRGNSAPEALGGGRHARAAGERGVTLLEMMVVVALAGIVLGISFPAISSGVESLRLSSAAGAVASFLNSALARAERRQEVVEVTISRVRGRLEMRSSTPGFLRTLELPEGVAIEAVLPRVVGEDDREADRMVMLYPGATAPRVGVLLANRKGVERLVRLDPITGVSEVEAPSQNEQATGAGR